MSQFIKRISYIMPELGNNLKTRLKYLGGDIDGRNQRSKLNSLKAAIKDSYQNAIILAESQEEYDIYNREFHCLINPDKLKEDYDNQILSIPYEDIQTNLPDLGETYQTLKCGDVFYWPQMDSYWIIYLHHISERAYFRADIRRCEKEVEINGRKYHVYWRGPVETTIPYNQKAKIETNDMNYSAIMFITKNEDTLDYFHRFTEIKVDGKTWQVAAKNEESGDGIIEIALDEYFNNTILEQQKEWEEKYPPEPIVSEIQGELEVYPYEMYEYTIEAEGGEWKVSNSKAKILKSSETSVTVGIVTGKSGNFDLSYCRENLDDVVLPITIKSL